MEMTLTDRDIEMIHKIKEANGNDLEHHNFYRWFESSKNIERLEFEEKAKRLGIEIPWKVNYET